MLDFCFTTLKLHLLRDTCLAVAARLKINGNCETNTEKEKLKKEELKTSKETLCDTLLQRVKNDDIP